jgi:hypothetical protein
LLKCSSRDVQKHFILFYLWLKKDSAKGSGLNLGHLFITGLRRAADAIKLVIKKTKKQPTHITATVQGIFIISFKLDG